MARVAVIAGVAALVLFGVGAVLVVGAAGALSETRIGETRTPVPGQRTVELEERKYILFYEVDEDAVAGGGGPSVSAGSPDIPVPPDLAVRITPSGGASPALTFDPYGSEFTVESGGRSAVAINTVDVPRASAYRVRTSGARAQSEPAVVLGEPSRDRVLRLVLGIVVLLLGVLAGITAVVLAILVRRRRRAG